MTNPTVIDDVKDIEENIDLDGKNYVNSSKRTYYKVGDTTRNGDIIEIIISQNKNLIIFINTREGLCWEIDNIVKGKNIDVVGEVQRLSGVLISNVARKYHFKINMLLGRLFAKALNSNNEDDIDVIFKEVQELIGRLSKKNENTISSGPNFEIYKTSNGKVSYWYNKLPDYLKPAIAEYNQLLNYAEVTLSKKDKTIVYPQIALALSTAFYSKEDEDVLRGFKKVEEFINVRTISNAHFWYVFYNSILFSLMIFLALLFYFYANFNKVFIVGCVGGLIGAFLSTLTRIDKLSFDILAPFRNVILQGYSRLLVGSICGLFVIIASQSNLILGTYSNNVYSLALFSIISGFSERFVPDLISSISSKEIEGENAKGVG
ncbi:hypothetical protein [Bacillus pretiosus]|uniref:hypothetical protein n=1 Tax=Bacillus pretiosus TaxID=2983392 RepID=UPI002EDAB2AF